MFFIIYILLFSTQHLNYFLTSSLSFHDFAFQPPEKAPMDRFYYYDKRDVLLFKRQHICFIIIIIQCDMMPIKCIAFSNEYKSRSCVMRLKVTFKSFHILKHLLLMLLCLEMDARERHCVAPILYSYMHVWFVARYTPPHK